MNLFRVNSMVYLFVLCFPFACLLFMASMSLLPDESVIAILIRFGLVAIPLTLGCLSFFWKSQIASFLLLFMWISVSIILASEGCTHFARTFSPEEEERAYSLWLVAVVLPTYGFLSTYAWLRWIWISSLTRGELQSSGVK